MKGTVVVCLKEMVEARGGAERWKAALRRAGLPDSKLYMALGDVPDAEVMRLFEAVRAEFGLTLEQAADAFGDHWMNVYVPRVYKVYLMRFPDLRALLAGINEVHERVTRTVPGARPPRFEFDWRDDRTLRVTYRSHRGLVDVFAGILRGAGRYYGERLTVRKRSATEVEVRFG